MDTPELSKYKKFRVWLNKKYSKIKSKRQSSLDYLALENGIFNIALDGIILSCSISYLFNPSIYTLILSLGCASFMLKRIFPFVIQFFSSISLVRVGK